VSNLFVIDFVAIFFVQLTSPSIFYYIVYVSNKTTFFKNIIVKSFLNEFWSFLHRKKPKYLKIYFSMISVRLALFSDDLKAMFVFW